MPIYIRYEIIASPAKAKAYPGAQALVNAVRRSHPRGVDQIFVAQSWKPGYTTGVGKNGIIAILIGLLLPAVQKIDAPNSTEVQLLQGALKPTGSVNVLMGDGSVRVLRGPISPLSWSDWKFDQDSGLE